MANVFISYSREDWAFVEPLCSALAASGQDVWLDAERIPPGTDWREGIERGIDEADAFAFVISPDSLASEVCRLELDYALARGKRIVPVVCRDPDGSSIPEALARVNWIFFRHERDGDALRNLVSALEAN